MDIFYALYIHTLRYYDEETAGKEHVEGRK
jgi:hypothetical protein